MFIRSHVSNSRGAQCAYSAHRNACIDRPGASVRPVHVLDSDARDHGVLAMTGATGGAARVQTTQNAAAQHATANLTMLRIACLDFQFFSVGCMVGVLGLIRQENETVDKVK